MSVLAMAASGLFAGRIVCQPGAGEWRRRSTRQGRPASEVIALPVKDPFHLPRAAIPIAQLMENA